MQRNSQGKATDNLIRKMLRREQNMININMEMN